MVNILINIYKYINIIYILRYNILINNIYIILYIVYKQYLRRTLLV